MRLLFCIATYLIVTNTIIASNITTQSVTLSITAVNELAISGTAPTLTIGSATAGALPNPATSSGITYSYTTNSTGTTSKKITGSLSAAMPTNTALNVKFFVPSSGGGTSAGSQPLSPTAATLISSIPVPSHQATQQLTYTFAQTTDTAVTAAFTRTVTFTLLDS